MGVSGTVGSLVVAIDYRQNRAMRYTGPPMTIANMRSLGCTALEATCLACRHSAEIDAALLHDDLGVPDAGRRMVCSACGARRVESRPAWRTLNRPGMGK